MITRKDIEMKLGEYQARHTGKDPFGPLTDLKDLYASLDSDGKKIMKEVLETKKEDSFWKDFISLFEQS